MQLNRSAFILAVALLVLFACTAQAQAPSPAQSINRTLNSINQQVLEMAEDFPADKYNFRPTKEVRSFGEVLVHILSGNVFAAKSVRDEKASWDELDPKDFKGKAEIVAAFKKATADVEAALKGLPEERFTKTLRPWLSVIEHNAEHYGQLVVYYRLNGMVPPASRPKAK